MRQMVFRRPDLTAPCPAWLDWTHFPVFPVACLHGDRTHDTLRRAGVSSFAVPCNRSVFVSSPVFSSHSQQPWVPTPAYFLLPLPTVVSRINEKKRDTESKLPRFQAFGYSLSSCPLEPHPRRQRVSAHARAQAHRLGTSLWLAGRLLWLLTQH